MDKNLQDLRCMSQVRILLKIWQVLTHGAKIIDL